MNSRKTPIALALLVGLVIGCSNNSPNSTQVPETTGENNAVTLSAPLQVTATNYPVKFFIERIGGDAVSVAYLIPADIDPAFWEPKSEDVVQLQNANLIFINGADYEKWLPTTSLSSAKIVDTTASFSDRFLTIENAFTHSHGPGEEHAHAGTAFTTWLDFRQAIDQAAAVRDALKQSHPERQDTFSSNFETLAAELLTLDSQIEDAIANSDLRTQPLIASHPVYDYLAERYDLDLKNVHWEPETVPTAEQWQELEELLAEHPAKWMIWEGEPNPESVKRLQAIGIESIVFDPVGNVPDTGDFLSIMQKNTQNLVAIFSD